MTCFHHISSKQRKSLVEMWMDGLLRRQLRHTAEIAFTYLDEWPSDKTSLICYRDMDINVSHFHFERFAQNYKGYTHFSNLVFVDEGASLEYRFEVHCHTYFECGKRGAVVTHWFLNSYKMSICALPYLHNCAVKTWQSACTWIAKNGWV